MSLTNCRVELVIRPNGGPVPSDFAVEEEAVGELADGDVRVGVVPDRKLLTENTPTLFGHRSAPWINKPPFRSKRW